MVELEIDLIAITEAWWDESLNWNTTIESYRPRRDKLGRRRGDVSFYLKELINCEELPLKNSQKCVENLWVKIKDRTDQGHVMVGI